MANILCSLEKELPKLKSLFPCIFFCFRLKMPSPRKKNHVVASPQQGRTRSERLRAIAEVKVDASDDTNSNKKGKSLLKGTRFDEYLRYDYTKQIE